MPEQPRRRALRAPTTETRRHVAYVRVSTAEQALHGHSLAAQRERLEAQAIATGIPLDDVIVDDGYSAKTLTRPGMQRLLDLVRDGQVAKILVVKLDRLTRSVGDLSNLIKLFTAKNVDLQSISESLDTSTAGGRMMMNMLATVSQWEREVISERTAATMAHLRKQRKAYSTLAPFGWRRVGHELVRNVEEQEVLEEMRALYTAGHSYRHIADILNDGGVVPRGKRWYHTSVKRILESRMTRESFAA